MKTKRLYYHDYGAGGVFFYFISETVEEVLNRFPELTYYMNEPPGFHEQTKKLTSRNWTFDMEEIDESISSLVELMKERTKK